MQKWKVNKIEENKAEFQNNIDVAQNIISFIETRDKFANNLSELMSYIAPDKMNSSVDVMVKVFEKALEEKEIDGVPVQQLTRSMNKYSNRFVDYSGNLTKPYDYGRMKGSTAMIRKAKKTYLDRWGIPDDKDALTDFIEKQRHDIIAMDQEIKDLGSDNYLNKRADEIEQEGKRNHG